MRRNRIAPAAVFAALALAPSASSEATPATAQAVQVISQQVELAQLGLTQQHQTLPDGYLTSVAALNYTIGHVLAGVYGYLEVHQQDVPTTTEQALQQQAGICGNATTVFRQVLGLLGYQTRDVGFYAKGGSHDTAEVFYSGAWHWFDPTFGIYYRQGTNVLPIAAVRKLKHPGQQAVTDQTLLWRQIMGATGWAAMQSGMGLPLNLDATVTYSS